jgi:transcriptional regulator with XRE-family HTH domain
MTKSFFSTNLRNLRKFKKISLEELAEAINISKSAISDYENDKFSPSLLICRKIADFFETTIDNLEFSEILEKNKAGEFILKQSEGSSKELYDANLQVESFKEKNETLEIEIKLLKQKVDGLQIQLRLHDQLKDSKLSEIDLLKTQIHLLEEKISFGVFGYAQIPKENLLQTLKSQ